MFIIKTINSLTNFAILNNLSPKLLTTPLQLSFQQKTFIEMEFLNIQSLLSKKINFSQFDLKDLETEEKDLLVLNLQSKIVKNTRFERMLNNEHLNIILTTLKGESSHMKTKIIEEIKNLDLISVFTKINGEKLDTFQIIKKYYNDIKGLLNIELPLTNKYIIIYIQYVLDGGEYDVNEIKRIIKRTKEQYEMTEDALVAEIEAELFAICLDENQVEEDIDEKQELEIKQEINNIIHNLNLEKELADEEILYVTRLEKYDEIITLFRDGLKIQYNMKTFLERLALPFLLDNPQVVSVDLIQLLLERVVIDNEITEGLKGYILQQMINFMTNEQ